MGESTSFDAESYMRNFLDTWNSQDIDGIVDLFADDAVITTPTVPGIPDTWRGRDEIRQCAQLYAPGFRAEEGDIQVHGDHIHFTARVRADALEQMAVDYVDEDNDLTVHEGKTQEFNIRFTPDSMEKIQDAVQRMQGGQAV